MSTFLNREIAAKAGRTTMAKLSPEQKTSLGERGGNALLLQQGVQYYAELGRRSAEARAKRRGEGE